MRARKLVGAVVATALLVVGCGDGGDDAGDEPASVGLDEGPTTSSTTSSTATASTAAIPAPSSTAAAASPPVVANRSDPELERWRLTLVVADASSFRSDESITLELTFVNLADEVQYVDSAQNVHFAILDDAGEAVWTDQSCGGSTEDAPGEHHLALEFAHGESGRFVERYPVSRSTGDADEECRVPPGRYRVIGQVAWCPPETVQHFDGRGSVCDEAAVRPLVSNPVAIEIT